MAQVYRKTLKGVEEVALKTAGMSSRLRPYLLLADGKRSLEQLQSAHGGLPAMEMVMHSLAEQGFLELVPQVQAGAVSNIVAMGEMRVGNGAVRAMAQPQAQPPAPVSPAASHSLEALEQIKLDMSRDAIQALGPDATPVVLKIRACASFGDLFVAMMGIKKIISLYAGDTAANKFETRYRQLSAM